MPPTPALDVYEPAAFAQTLRAARAQDHFRAGHDGRIAFDPETLGELGSVVTSLLGEQTQARVEDAVSAVCAEQEAR